MTLLPIVDAYDVTLLAADTTPGDPNLDQLVLSTDTVVLTKTPRGVPDMAVVDGYSITWTAVDDADGVTIEGQLVGGRWELSTVTGATVPDPVGPVATFGPTDVAAGDQITLDFTPAMQTVSDGDFVWNGLRLVETAGDALTVWGFAASDPTLRPAVDVDFDDELPTPTGISPGGGRLVSISQPPIRVLNYAAELGGSVIDGINLQWWEADPGVDYSDPDGDLTQATTSATFVTAGTAFSLTTLLGVNAPKWFRVRMSRGGKWSPWSGLEDAGYAVVGSLVVDDDNLSLDPNPLRSWTYGGTQALSRVTRRRLEAPTLTLDPEPPPVVGPTQAGYVVGDHAEVKDYRSYVDRVEVWDDLDREAVPGGPDHATVDFVWSLTDDASIAPVTIESLTLLAGSTPFPDLVWSTPHKDDMYRVRRAEVVNGEELDEVNVSGLIPGRVVGDDDNPGEMGYLRGFVDFTAAPNSVYQYRVQRVTDHRGSATGDKVTIYTETRWVHLANPDTGEWVRLLNADIGKWVREEPFSASFAPAAGDGFYRRLKGDRLAVTTTVTGEIWVVDDLGGDYLTAAIQRRWFSRMVETDKPILLVTTHDVIEVSIGDAPETPLDDNYDLPWEVEFGVWQTGPGRYSSSEFLDTGQVETVLIGFEGWTEGATVTSADASGKVLGISGSGKARLAAAARDSLFGLDLEDVPGGSHARIDVNPLDHTIAVTFPRGIPGPTSSDFNLIRWKNSAGGQIAALHEKTNGTFSLLDAAGSGSGRVTSARARDDVPFRVVAKQVWRDAESWFRLAGFIGPNLYGLSPDWVLEARLAAASAPSNEVWVGTTTTFTGGGNIAVDDIAIANSASVDLLPLGDTLGGSVGLAHATAMSPTSIRVVAGRIVGTDVVKLAWSTTQGPDDFPASPTYGAPVDVDDFRTARLVNTGSLTGGTVYYFAVADADGNMLAGSNGSLRTLPAPNTSTTLKAGQWSCQGNHFSSFDQWVQLGAYGAHILVGQGDFHYGGGGFRPGQTEDVHIDKIVDQVETAPAMNHTLSNASLEETVSDHDGGCSNGQYKNDAGDYDYAGQLDIWRTNIPAFRKIRPVVYADTATTPRGRYYAKPWIRNRPGGLTSVLFLQTDCRSLDRSDGLDPDGPDKTLFGAPQLAFLAANLLTNGLNVISLESSAAFVSGSDSIDKVGGFFWEWSNVIAPMLAGKQVDILCGDRHFAAYLSHLFNPILPDVDIFVASGMDMHGLHTIDGELYKDDAGATAIFGNDPDLDVHIYGRYQLVDANAGSIVRTWTGWDATSNTAAVGPYSRTFTYT